MWTVVSVQIAYMIDALFLRKSTLNETPIDRYFDILNASKKILLPKCNSKRFSLQNFRNRFELKKFLFQKV